MANASIITLTELKVDTANAAPTNSVLDTGTVAVTLPLTIPGDTHNVLLVFANTAVAADTMAVVIKAGTTPPAFLGSAGDLTLAVAQNEVHYVVIDSARFIKANGKIDILFTPASTKAQTMTIKAIQLPK
jgi:hypothetical protein